MSRRATVTTIAAFILYRAASTNSSTPKEVVCAHNESLSGEWSTPIGRSVDRPRGHLARKRPFVAAGVSREVDAMRRRNCSQTVRLRPSDARAPPPPPRKRLLVKHFPKAGGSYVKGVLADGAVEKLAVLSETQQVGSDDRRSHFVIALVREPCSYYVSLWSFGSATPQMSAMAGALIEHRSPARDFYGKTAPFDGAEDVERFRSWLQHDDVRGVMAARFVAEYSTTPFVDCWVDTANMNRTLHACLRAFERQGGRVDWDKIAAAEDEALRVTKGRARRLARSGQNASPHASCETYYTAALSSFVRYGFDRAVFAAFGYPGCCSRSCPRCGELTGQDLDR